MQMQMRRAHDPIRSDQRLFSCGEG